MNRRGQEKDVLYVIMQIGFAVIILTSALYQASLLKTDVTAKRIHTASDLGLTISSMFGSSGNIGMVYVTTVVQEFDYDISRQSVRADYEASAPAILYYSSNANVLFSDKEMGDVPLDAHVRLKKPDRIHLTTSGNYLVADDGAEATLAKLPSLRKCPEAISAVDGIVLDNALNSAGITFTAKFKEILDVEALKPQTQLGSKLYVRVEEGPQVIYVDVDNYETSYSLACNIANQMAMKGVATSIIPTDITHRPYLSLDRAKLGVVVSSMQDNGEIVGESISDGIAAWRMRDEL